MTDLCPLGGPRCPEAICDCFIDQYPADPLGLHPEAYAVVEVIENETEGTAS